MKARLTKSDFEFIRDLPVCRLATVTEECEPIVRPVWPVFDGKNVYVASDPKTKKLVHIAQNPKVSVVFDDYDQKNWTNLKGVLIQGVAKVIWKGKEYRYAHELLQNKYPEYRTKEGGWKEGEIPIIKIKLKNFYKWANGEWSK